MRACVWHRGLAPLEAVGDVVERLAGARTGERRHESIGGWLAQLSRGERALACAEAVTWSTRLLTAIDWLQLDGHAEIGGCDRWWNGPRPAGAAIRGRADVRIHARAPNRPAEPGSEVQRPEVLFSVLGGRPGPTDRAGLGLAALVDILARPSAPTPARVVGWWPASGRVTVVPVTMRTMAQTIEAVAAAARLRRRSAAPGSEHRHFGAEALGAA